MINISELPTPDLQYIYIYKNKRVQSKYIINIYIYNLNEIFLTTYGIVSYIHTVGA